MAHDSGGGGGAAPGHYPYLGDDPADVRVVAATLERQARAMTALDERLRGTLPRLRGSWREGQAGDTAVTAVGTVLEFTPRLPPCFTIVRDALEEHAERLRAARTRVDELNSAYQQLEPVQRRVASFGDWIPASRESAYDAAYTDYRVVAQRVGFDSVAHIDATYRRVHGEIETYTDRCAGVLRGQGNQFALVGGRSGMSVLASQLPRATAAEILAARGLTGAPGTPEQVKALWDSLSPTERQTLLDSDPRLWGNTDGVPCVDRDDANRTALTQDLRGYEEYFRARGVPLRYPLDLGKLTFQEQLRLGLYEGDGSWNSTTAAYLTGYNTARSVEGTLTSPDNRVATYLLGYQPTADLGEGRAAIAFGNPDTARNVSVCVPGLESRGSKMDLVGSDARNLQAEASRIDPSTSVIAWQGYNAPEFANVAFEGHAQDGAPLLASFVHGLNVTHDGDPRVTVIGHSYGSTTTGLALQNTGMAADVDQVVLIGSPGVGGGAHDVAGLHLRPDQLYVGAASRDGVTTLFPESALGTDPTESSFGGTRFQAENPDRTYLDPRLPDHSRYYDPGTESLYSMAEVVTGHGDRLAGQGLTAAGRTYEQAGDTYVKVDPEAGRTPTVGHYH